MKRPPPDLSIRPATIRDLWAIAYMEREIGERAWSMDSIRQELMHPMGATWIAAPTAAPLDVAGYLFARTAPPPLSPGDQLYITKIATHPIYRRRGVATRLLHHLLELGRRKGHTICVLDCARDNGPAVGLYRKLGFRWADRRGEVMTLRLTRS